MILDQCRTAAEKHNEQRLTAVEKPNCVVIINDEVHQNTKEKKQKRRISCLALIANRSGTTQQSVVRQ